MEEHTFLGSRVKTKPNLLQWREEGLKPSHDENKV